MSALRVSLVARLARALALPISVAFLLSFTGVALGASTPRAANGTLTASLTRAAQALENVTPDVAEPPNVTSIEPGLGATSGGTSVTITGTGFTEGATVTIGSKATSVDVVSETEITAKTAATAAGTDEVIVADSNGTSTEGPFFSYIAPPKVSSISPTEGPVAGKTVIKVKGTGFRESSTVTVGGKAAKAVSVISETELTAKTPAGSVGKDEVVVTDTYGSSTAGPDFTYLAAPVVTSISPTAGTTAGGTAVKIIGTGFLKGATVKIGGKATSVVVVSATEITAKTAAGSAGKEEVVVTDTGGTSRM
ncbi:MAG: IPT/TIG domain-containing protein [Solirubrobacteraceae bacterium]